MGHFFLVIIPVTWQVVIAWSSGCRRPRASASFPLEIERWTCYVLFILAHSKIQYFNKPSGSACWPKRRILTNKKWGIQLQLIIKKAPNKAEGRTNSNEIISRLGFQPNPLANHWQAKNSYIDTGIYSIYSYIYILCITFVHVLIGKKQTKTKTMDKRILHLPARI